MASHVLSFCPSTGSLAWRLTSPSAAALQYAARLWAPATAASHAPFSAHVIDVIYEKKLRNAGFPRATISALEVSQYLEAYLYPNLDAATAALPHVLSVVLMANEKCREGHSPWGVLQTRPSELVGLLERVAGACLDVSRSVSVVVASDCRSRAPVAA